MNYLRLALVAILLGASAHCAFADSIPTYYITHVVMFMGPNDGSGDNVSFTFTGPGLNIVGYGGMACFDWCSGPISDPSIAATGQIFIGAFGIVTINGKTYDRETFAFTSTFFSGDAPNRLSSASVGAGDTYFQFNLLAPTNGGWNLNFDYFPPQDGQPGYYLFTQGNFDATAQTPEPGSISLVLTGLGAIAGIAKKKGIFSRAPR